jgi:class 3 adenylate cyclase/tetratricopeptide (TPR) repeat protein
MKCPKCQAENPEQNQFCRKCGAKLSMTCPNCSADILLADKFCGKCGHDLGELTEASAIDFNQPQSYTPKFLADKILNSRSSIEGERKLVTVLFADVANYTNMSEKLDPEEVHQIMDGCFKILMDEIHRYEGTINQFTGDGVMALFGAPVSHEGHAQRVCYAALSIQKAMEEYGAGVAKDTGVEFKMRIGVNTGKVIVGAIGDDLRMDYTAVGDTTNLAARIQQTAKPGEVWLSRETQSIIKGFFQVEFVGDHELKGKAEKQTVYKLLAEHKEVRTRFEAGLAKGVTGLVGRQSEMQILKAAWERARSGKARLVDVVGEAGVGKSRLIYEFQKTIADEATFLTGVCIHYGRNINFLPLIDIVRTAFGIEEGMSEEEAGRRIREKATENLGKMIPFYRNLLSLKVDDKGFNSLNPEGRKFGTFEAVKNLLLSISESKPLVVFIEDVHWIDKISEEFFVFFSHSIQGQMILILSAYRPEGAPGWAKGPYYRHLGLETLGENLEKLIVDRTGGNPFFVEEMVRELMERNELMKEGNRYILRNTIDRLDIPGTVQGIIAARMDRLSEDLKKTMQVASVIGRDFAYIILRSIMKLGDELRTHLTNLVGIEVLYEKTLYPELEYIFKHALTQEVAYGSLLKQRRKELHGRMGEKSYQHNAVQTASEFFLKAFEVVEKAGIALDVETKIRLHRGRARASFLIGDINTASEEFRKVIELSQRHGMFDHERKALMGLTPILWSWPARAEAERILKEGIDRAREKEDKTLEFISTLGLNQAMYGQPHLGNQLMLDGERIAKETGKPIPLFVARLQRSLTERWLGGPRKTIDLTEGMVESLRKTYALTTLAPLIQNRGVALAEIGRIEDAIAIIRNGIDILEKFGQAWKYNLRSDEITRGQMEKYPMGIRAYAEMLAQANVNLMENLFDQGKQDAAWDRIKSFEEEAKSEDFVIMRHQWESRMNYLATQILLHRNELGRAEALIQNNLESAQKKHMRKKEGSFLRMMGEVRIRHNEFEKAIETFEEAIIILKEVGNPSQLWQAHASHAAAYSKLERFSEEQEQWGAAAEIILNTANDLSDRQLREGFLNAASIRNILAKAES